MSALSERFVKAWEGPEKTTPPVSVRIRDALRHPGPLKARLDKAIRRIELQIQRLDQAGERFSQRDKSIFAKIVEAYTKHDMARANVLSSELAEIRKMQRTILHSRLALEQISMRLKTVSELGDLVVALAPAIGILRAVQVGLGTLMPEAERELSQVGNMLSSIVMDAGQISGLTLNFESVTDEAQRILNEAAVVAEQRIKEKLPELPVGIPVGERAPAGVS